MPSIKVLDKKKVLEATRLLRDTEMTQEDIANEVGMNTQSVARINNGDLGPENEKQHRHMFDYYPVRKLGFTEEELEDIARVMPLLKAKMKLWEDAEKKKKLKKKLKLINGDKE